VLSTFIMSQVSTQRTFENLSSKVLVRGTRV